MLAITPSLPKRGDVLWIGGFRVLDAIPRPAAPLWIAIRRLSGFISIEREFDGAVADGVRVDLEMMLIQGEHRCLVRRPVRRTACPSRMAYPHSRRADRRYAIR